MSPKSTHDAEKIVKKLSSQDREVKVDQSSLSSKEWKKGVKELWEKVQDIDSDSVKKLNEQLLKTAETSFSFVQQLQEKKGMFDSLAVSDLQKWLRDQGGEEATDKSGSIMVDVFQQLSVFMQQQKIASSVSAGDFDLPEPDWEAVGFSSYRQLFQSFSRFVESFRLQQLVYLQQQMLVLEDFQREYDPAISNEDAHRLWIKLFEQRYQDWVKGPEYGKKFAELLNSSNQLRVDLDGSLNALLKALKLVREEDLVVLQEQQSLLSHQNTVMKEELANLRQELQAVKAIVAGKSR